jgi:choline dehydrogenase
MNSTQEFDILIVGGGTAGAILAARLSENPQNSVLLLEAGRDTEAGRVPADNSHPITAATHKSD